MEKTNEIKFCLFMRLIWKRKCTRTEFDPTSKICRALNFRPTPSPLFGNHLPINSYSLSCNLKGLALSIPQLVRLPSSLFRVQSFASLLSNSTQYLLYYPIILRCGRLHFYKTVVKRSY